MQRITRRLVLAILAGLTLSAFAATPALATTVTTEPASNRTTTTAVLNGVIDTGGVATAWQFQWGRTKSYGHGTPLEQIPAGRGTVPVSWKLQNLSPNTTYHFRLVATTGTGTTNYPLNVTFGGDQTFATKTTGRLVLIRTRLPVVHGFVSVQLRCVSGLSCRGRFTINTRAKLSKSKHFATVLCATTTYTIGQHKTKTINARVRGGCLALLRTSPHQTRTAKLTSNPRTGQHAVIRTVILTLG